MDGTIDSTKDCMHFSEYYVLDFPIALKKSAFIMVHNKLALHICI